MVMKNQILTVSQYVHAITTAMKVRSNERPQILDQILLGYGISKIQSEEIKRVLLSEVVDMVGVFNDLQRSNILDMLACKESKNRLTQRILFYGGNETNVTAILNLYEDYLVFAKGVRVKDLDGDFSGVQIATRDSLVEVRSAGYTGYWKINPKRVKNARIQVASMASEGPTPRGYYLNAEVDEVEAVKTSEGIRYKVKIKNAVIINSGNPKVKFKRSPVTYIK
jgi:hypothetical protein